LALPVVRVGPLGVGVVMCASQTRTARKFFGEALFREVGEVEKGALGGRAGFGGVGDERLADVCGEFECLVGEVEITCKAVLEQLSAGPVGAYIVGGPSASEVVAACEQLADEVREVAVVGFTTGLGAEATDTVVGDAGPIAVEVCRCRACRVTALERAL